jgi:hypothetical protein
MPYIEKRIKRYFCAVFWATNAVPAFCSGVIEQKILSFCTTHRLQEPAKPCIDSIQPQSPVNTQENRGLFWAAFGVIGGAV